MKKTVILLFVLFGWTSFALAQDDKFYISSGGEMIFSFADISDEDPDVNSLKNIMRWSPVFNVQFYGNYNFTKNIGGFLGLSVRNVGFIEKYITDNQEIRVKYRNYNLGIPVGLKIGNMDKLFLYGGYEIEFPFHTKIKTFTNDGNDKAKDSEWFSSKVPTMYNSFFVGIQFPYGMNIKFKYYMDNWFNEDYTENGARIYEGKNANVYYFSLNFNIFKNVGSYTAEYK